MAGHEGLEGTAPLGKGLNDYRVEMWYQGTYIGYALIKGTYSQRSARVGALRGIACTVYPMCDRDKVRFVSAIAARKDNP